MQRRFRHKRQRRDQRLGMDELMIVNPSRNGVDAVFLGDDGVLRAARPSRSGAIEDSFQRSVSLAGTCSRCGAVRRRRNRNY